MQNNFILYVHITPSNKKYFGITCRDIDRRWGYGEGYKNNKHFYRAIQKYGWDNIQHIILADSLSKEWALRLEELFILKYDTTNVNKGYNRSTGGDWGGSGYKWHQSEELKQRLHDIKIGIPLSEQHKQALSDAWIKRKERGEVVWNKGLKLKDTGMIDNFIKAGIENAKRQRKPVYKLDLDNNIVSEYESVKSAAKAQGCNNTCAIHAVLSGRAKLAYGYKWKYKMEADNG